MTAEPTNAPEIPLVCNLEAIPADERAAHEQRAGRLFYETMFIEMRELDAGYEFAFPVAEFPNVAKFIEFERLCCSFWNFGLQLAPESEIVWLALTGGNGVKTFMEKEILPTIGQSKTEAMS